MDDKKIIEKVIDSISEENEEYKRFLDELIEKYESRLKIYQEEANKYINDLISLSERNLLDALALNTQDIVLYSAKIDVYKTVINDLKRMSVKYD